MLINLIIYNTKGIIHPKIIFHTFTPYNFVDSGSGDISIPRSHSGVS